MLYSYWKYEKSFLKKESRYEISNFSCYIYNDNDYNQINLNLIK